MTTSLLHWWATIIDRRGQRNQLVISTEGSVIVKLEKGQMSTEDDADKEAQCRRALLHNAPRSAPRKPQLGEEVWRLLDNETGRVQSCESRDNSRAGPGWEVQILEAGEILVSRQCANEVEARFVGEAARKDLARTGWAEHEKGGA
jgi:hypothetical protein